MVIDFLQKMNWEPISAWNDFTFFFYVGVAGNTSLVVAGTHLGATAVVTPGSAGWYGHIREGEPSAQCNDVALGTTKVMLSCHVSDY